MHKKINSTTEKIYNAFAEVLLEKAYADVRIQDVLDKSGVARSTFYAHYKTKEELLKSICSTIFGHVFSHSLAEEKATIFKILHIRLQALYHAHFLSLARRKNACSRHFAFAKQGHFPQLFEGRTRRICNRLRRKQFRNGQKPTQVLESQFDNRKFRFACGILGRNRLHRHPRTPDRILFDYERITEKRTKRTNGVTYRHSVCKFSVLFFLYKSGVACTLN